MTLMDYVSDQAGAWTKASGAQSNRIELSQWDDAVTFQGPLHLNVAVVAQSVLTPLNGGATRNSENELYHYDLEIPAGYSWRYQMAEAPAASRLLPAYRVVFRSSPCARTIPVQAPHLPCDFAVGNRPGIGEFFPVGCEPCGTGPVRMPPTCGPSLAVKPASGGCVRPRFFNGMFITREDLETELRYLRIKNKLQRRADGQGVVWGLGIRRQGSAVCVQPGYALDCCGNDLTVTSVYQVDAATLLSDPAICNQITGRQQCLDLLLEYIECPEEPRPVHGDPCDGSASSCEMSRVRETVRLRLVPPRDHKPARPIQTFLSTISQGTPPATTAAGSVSSAKSTTTSVPASLPFQIQFSNTLPGTNAPPPPLILTPTPDGAPVTGNLALSTQVNTGQVITISLPVPGSAFAFTGESVVDDPANDASSRASNVKTPTPSAPGSISWQVTLTNPRALWDKQWRAAYTVNWNAPAGSTAASGTYQGTSSVQFGVVFAKSFDLAVTITTHATLTVPSVRKPFPCLNDTCCPDKPLFSVFPPWADDNPLDPGHAADPKILALALVYALLAGTTSQESSEDGATNARVSLAARLYEAVAALLDPAASKDPAQLSRMTLAVQQLLNDWCCSFLYPGPSCDGEPHGVVIGCATVSSGEIQSISPWGGRRWVMHYPLLAYWGEQFGIVPPDVLASRLFSVICCLGNLPAPGRTNPEPVVPSVPSKEYAVGSGYLRMAATAPAQASAASMPTRSISLTDFAARTLSALARPAAPSGTPMAVFTPEGFPSVELVMPDLTAGTVSSGAAAPTPAATSSALQDLANHALAQPALRAEITPLLRDFVRSLTVRLTDSLPISSLAPAGAIVEPLTEAGLTNVGAILARSPQSIYTDVLGKTEAGAVSDLVQKAEAKVAHVAQTVADAIKTTAAARSLVSTDDLSTTAARTALARPIAETLRLIQSSVVASIGASLS